MKSSLYLLIALFQWHSHAYALCPGIDKVSELANSASRRYEELRQTIAVKPHPTEAETETLKFLDRERIFSQLSLEYRRKYDAASDILDKEYFGKKMDYYYDSYTRVAGRDASRNGLQTQPTNQETTAQKTITRVPPETTAVSAVEKQQSISETLDMDIIKAHASSLEIADKDQLVDEGGQLLRVYAQEDLTRIVAYQKSQQEAKAKTLYMGLLGDLKRAGINQKFCRLKMERVSALLSKMGEEENHVDQLLRISEAFDQQNYKLTNARINELLAKVAK